MKTLLKRMNWVQFVSMAALIAIGTTCIWSAGNAREALFHGMWKSTLRTALAGLAVYAALAWTDYRRLFRWLSAPAYFGALALLAAAVKKLRPSYTAWFIAYYVIAIGATWLLSAPRYLMAMPVLPMALGRLTEKESAKTCAVIVLSLLWPLYFLAFLQSWQVW